MAQFPIIFLDIDGVLNSQVYFAASKGTRKDMGDQLDPRAINLLNILCSQVPALRIVVSSTWRINHSIEELKELFQARAFFGHIIDKTGRSTAEGLRGNEILNWIKNNESLIGARYHEYNRYVIFDDDSDMLYWQRDNFIHVDPYCGLTPRNIFHANKILTEPPKGSIIIE